MKLKTLITAIIISITLSSCCIELYDDYLSTAPKKNNSKTVNHTIASPVASEVAAE